jgi:tRNA dimethylallyltransferase
LTIGTAKPTREELMAARHYMVDIVSINDIFNAYMFAEQANTMLMELFKNTDIVLMVGGSGLYIDATCSGLDNIPDIEPSIRESVNNVFLTDGIEALRAELRVIDPDFYKVVDLSNHARLIRGVEVFRQTGRPYSSFRQQRSHQRPYQVLRIALQRTRQDLYNRIDQRVDMMMEHGLLSEVRSLNHVRHLNALQTVGYKELFEYIDGNISISKAIEDIKRNTRRYAKKQESWFGRDLSTVWIEANAIENIINLILKVKNKRS